MFTWTNPKSPSPPHPRVFTSRVLKKAEDHLLTRVAETEPRP